LLRKELRLRKNADFKNVYENGRSVAGRYVSIYYIKRGDQKGTRIGIVAGKKVGGAVARNRVKRVLREILSRYQDLLCEEHDIVVVARKSSLTAEFHKISADVGNILKGCGLLKGM